MVPNIDYDKFAFKLLQLLDLVLRPCNIKSDVKRLIESTSALLHA